MRRVLPFVLLLIIAGAAPAPAQPVEGSPAPAVGEIMLASQVRAGMIAVGKTVFSGTDIEEFHLQILGVIPKVRAGTDIILARVLDGLLIERQSGILQGMSGSPVYVDGRLIGAIAFSWPFSKEPVAGITPIEDMLRVLPAQAPGQGGPSAPSLPQPVIVDGRTMDRVRILDPGSLPQDAGEAEGVLTLQPMGSLLFASGLSPRALDRLRDVVAPFGAAVTQGVGGSADFQGGELQPGASLGVQLVRGDFDVTAIGTVTYVKGDRVLAFGHPMMSMGDVDLTLTTAYINTIVPSYAAGMKMGSAGRPVGRLAQDRLWAVVGITGEQAQTIPVAVTVVDPARGINHTYNAEIAPHRRLAPGLAATVVLSAVDRAWEHVGEGTARVSVEIDGERRAIRRSDIAFSPADAAASVTAEVAAPMTILMENEFGGLQVKAVRVKVSLTDKRQTARLENISVQPGKIKAGDTLDLCVRLRPFKGAPVEKHLALKLPPDLPDGSLRLGVAGGDEAQLLRATLGLARPRAFNLDQLVDIYETTDPADDIVALLALPSSGAAVEGRRVPSLPSYYVEMLTDARAGTISPERDHIKATLSSEWFVEGRQVITVEIEGKPGAAKRGAPGARPAPSAKGEPPAEEPPAEDEAREAMLAPMSMTLATEPSAESGQEQKKEETAKQEPEKKKDAPVGREPSSLTQAKRADFWPGEFEDVAVDEDGGLTLAPAARALAKLDEPIISALLVHGGDTYVATAPGGRVRKFSADGQVAQTWDTGAALVTALAAGPQGAILAGAAPGGRILVLGDDGKTQDYFATGEDTVWCITPARDGGIYAGTGPHAKVFLVSEPGRGKLWAELPATNVYALAVANNLLYAGTGNAGVLYAMDFSGQVRAAYDSDQEAVASLAVGPEGDIYVGTAPGAVVVRLRPGGAEQIMEAEGEVLAALAAGPSGLLYAVTAEDAVVYEVDPGRKTARLLRKPEQGRGMALAVDEQGAVSVADSNPAAVVRLGPELAERGAFTSTPQPAPAGTRWGALSCAVERPAQTLATFQTRSGDSADPDDHWSPWSLPADIDSAADIMSPPAEFLQYRINLSAQQRGATPRVGDLQISYLPPNREPTVSFSAPKPAERLRESVDIKWKGQDPDRDKLVYDLYSSADGGNTWSELKADIDGDTYSWDTSDSKDGSYVLRVVASDRPSNPGAPRQKEARRAVWVDNTPPTVLILRHAMVVGANGVVAVRGAAADELSPLQGVNYRVDDGKWRAAIVEGALGTRQLSFRVETEPLKPGEYRVHVQVFDQAGNSAQDEVRAKVEQSAAGETSRPAATSAAP